jgi:hypothetical protein
MTMDTGTPLSNSLANCRRTAILVSAWAVGLTIWAGGMAGLAMFF